jgi:hypothetical protein
MLSEHSMRSDWALDELDFAKMKAKRLVIVHLEELQMTDEFYFTYHKYDQIVWNSLPQREKLVSDIKRWTENNIQIPVDTGFVITEEDIKQAVEHDAIHNEKDTDTGLNAETQAKEKGKNLAAFANSELHCIEKDGKYGFADKDGNIVIPCEWNDAMEFSEELAFVADEKWKYGYIDKEGRPVIPCKWQSAWNFTEGLAPVMNSKDKWGYIDKTGELAITCRWAFVDTFCNGRAKVQNSQLQWKYIDKKGKVVKEVKC